MRGTKCKAEFSLKKKRAIYFRLGKVINNKVQKGEQREDQ